MQGSNQSRIDKTSKWEKIFSVKAEDSKKKVWRIITIVSCIALISMTIFQTIFQTIESVPIYWQILGNIINYFGIPVTTAVLSAAFINIVYVAYENSQLHSIKNFEYKELAQDFFEVLEKSKGKKRKNEHIDVTLSSFKKNGQNNPELLQIRISYEFEENILDESISFMFERNNKGDISSFLSSSNSKLENYEFYWGNDETGFPAQKINDEDYIIEQISIDSHPIKRDCIHCVKTDIEDGRQIVYKADIPKMIKDKKQKNEFYNMALMVSFPMEAESILFITHEYPTKTSEMSVNYSEIADNTEIYTMPMTGPIPVNTQENSNPSLKQYRYDGWLIPKTGYVIAWWKR